MNLKKPDLILSCGRYTEIYESFPVIVPQRIQAVDDLNVIFKHFVDFIYVYISNDLILNVNIFFYPDKYF